LAVLLNRENTNIERLLVFHSVPQQDLYVRSDAVWLKSGIELRKLKSFDRVVKKILTDRRTPARNRKILPFS
jgi:hypothetical protein